MQFSLPVFRWTFEKQFSLLWNDTQDPPNPTFNKIHTSKSSFPLWQVEVFLFFPSFLHHVVSHVLSCICTTQPLSRRAAGSRYKGTPKTQCWVERSYNAALFWVLTISRHWGPSFPLQRRALWARGNLMGSEPWSKAAMAWHSTINTRIHPYTNFSSLRTGTYLCIYCVGQSCLSGQHQAFTGSQESHHWTKWANLFVFSKWRTSTIKGVFNTQC